MGRVPHDAFEQYAAAGDERSYAALARKFGVTKRAIGKRASRERWQERLEAIQAGVRERADARLIETLDDMNTRHLKLLKVLELKALEALKTMPIHSAAAAARALDSAIGREREIRGASKGGTPEGQLTIGDMVAAAGRLADDRRREAISITVVNAIQQPNDGRQARLVIDAE